MKYALIGDKLSHSYSSDIHSVVELDYSLVEIEKDKLQSFVNSNIYNGFNVTIPYKESIMPFLDQIDSRAKEIGAVNTVAIRSGKSKGYNTDIDGLLFLLKKNKITLKNKKVAVMGSGGASKTVCYVAKLCGCKTLSVISRSGEINYQNCYERLFDIDIIFNATPVGMENRESKDIIDLSLFKKLKVAVDLIYNPNRTSFLLGAEKLKLKIANGLDMLIYQAIKSQEIWGEKSQLSFDKIKKNVLQNKLNIVLSGMPSSGKTTVGKLVAKNLNKAFFDIDDEFIKRTNTSPSEYIIKNGEESFRKLESEIIFDLHEKKGVVIALGGGSILDAQNEMLLKQNGIVIYLDRKLKYLSVENRPLSNKKGVKGLYKERKERYFESFDIKVSNNKDVEKTAKEIIKVYENTCS